MTIIASSIALQYCQADASASAINRGVLRIDESSSIRSTLQQKRQNYQVASLTISHSTDNDLLSELHAISLKIDRVNLPS